MCRWTIIGIVYHRNKCWVEYLEEKIKLQKCFVRIISKTATQNTTKQTERNFWHLNPEGWKLLKLVQGSDITEDAVPATRVTLVLCRQVRYQNRHVVISSYLQAQWHNYRNRNPLFGYWFCFKISPGDEHRVWRRRNWNVCPSRRCSTAQPRSCQVYKHGRVKKKPLFIKFNISD
jgi:hypothetical protein